MDLLTTLPLSQRSFSHSTLPSFSTTSNDERWNTCLLYAALPQVYVSSQAWRCFFGQLTWSTEKTNRFGELGGILPRPTSLNSNRIVTNTRVAMYNLHMILTPIYATTSAIILYTLFKNLRSISDGQVTKGYFMSQPNLGHQTVLVPIELKQVRKLEDDEPDIASIGVQTSGNQSHLNWS
ncbi:hypothetical protein QR680_019435 [Steinernema hermaphroditum]|uniref:Uncharacterized protein n=1 Tax=Steinernema hermaphroditum TaxID=289476 RepID=A0AA39GNB9_9BILA|nr:hypothetical protein QR680_019435 [Steinernema hermaphroditum]